jgi:hypothetical protein
VMQVEVGQKFFAVYPSYRQADDPRTEEITVTKVGRKWAHFGEGWLTGRFEIEDGSIDGNGKVYASRAQWDQERAMETAWAAVRNKVSGMWRLPEHLTVADLAELKRLLLIP